MTGPRRKPPRNLYLPAVLVAAALLVLVSVLRAAAGEPAALTPLPEFPVCEASALARFPCATGGDRCVLVGDNEQETALFEYTLGPSGLLSKSRAWMREIAGGSIGDVEALAPLGGDLLAVGSHGRRKNCTRDEERLRVLRLQPGPGTGLRSVGAITLDDEDRWQARLRDCARELIRLPEGAPEDAVSLRDAVCGAIESAEKAAGEGKQDDPAARARCAATFNVEGALVVSEDGAGERLWLGLRAPLLENEAILLRVAGLESGTDGIRFDGVATVDLGGLGIRDLAADGDWVYGLAGPIEDGGVGELWRVGAADVRSGRRIGRAGVLVRDLPGAAEGLLVQTPPGRATIVVDGAESGGRCTEPAQQLSTGVPVLQRLPR